MSLRFYNASYLDEQFNIITDAEIITDGEFIAYAGKRSLKNKCEREIDLKGKLVLPGFINTHAHSPLVLLRGAAENLSLFDWLENIIYPTERKLTEEHIYWGTQLALAESLKHGITCTADMYFFPETIAEVYEKNNVSAVLLGTASDKDSSPKKALSARSASSIPPALSTPRKMGKSYSAPSFFTSAGERLTIILPTGKAKPQLRIAERTRSRDSLTAVPGSPTISKAGMDWEKSTSARTG